jgi:hypothetical protein
MHQGRVGLAGLEHVGDDGEFFEFKRNRAGNVLRFRPGRRQTHCDHLADIADLVSRQDRLDRIFETFEGRGRNDGFDPGEMFCGENGISESFGDVDLLKPRMGDGAAHKGNIASARHANIAHILSPSTEEAMVLLARDRGSDSILCHGQLLLTRNAAELL